MFEATSLVAKGTGLFRALDFLADATNIILILWLLAVLVIETKKRALNGKNWLAVVLSIALVYILKTFDSKLQIWDRVHLNYSTHSALAAAVVALLFFLDRPRRLLALAVFVAYEALQMLLGFHSLLDILTTLAVLMPLVLLCLRYGMPERLKAESI